MAWVLVVDDAYASALLNLLATGRQTLPVQVIDSSTLGGIAWDVVLATGATSNGTSPEISAGDSLLLDGGSLTSDGVKISLLVGTDGLHLSAGGVTLDVDTIARAGVAGDDLWVQSAGNTGGGAGGTLYLIAGTGTDGGYAVLRAGAATTGTPGAAIMQDSSGADRVAASYLGIAFNGGVPANKPSITGSRGGNAALASLLTALASMGLITDNTT